ECAVDEDIRCDADGHTVGAARIQAAYADDAVSRCQAIDFSLGSADSGCADPLLARPSSNLQRVSRSILDSFCSARPGFDAELYKERQRLVGCPERYGNRNCPDIQAQRRSVPVRRGRSRDGAELRDDVRWPALPKSPEA